MKHANVRRIFLAVAIAISGVAGAARPASAQPSDAASPDEGGSPKVVTMTRWMKVFSDLENQLALALQKKDEAQVTQLLADDFELRRTDEPGEPLPRAEWLRANLGRPVATFEATEMATRAFGDVILVSFRWIERAPGGSPAESTYVDAWTKSGDSWKLAARYATALTTANAPLPKVAPPHEVRPDGKG